MSNTYRENSKQNPVKAEIVEKTENHDIEKINVYRVDKRKLQNLPTKVVETTPMIIEVKDYTENIIKMKNDLAQSSLTIVK